MSVRPSKNSHDENFKCLSNKKAYLPVAPYLQPRDSERRKGQSRMKKLNFDY